MEEIINVLRSMKVDDIKITREESSLQGFAEVNRLNGLPNL